VSFAKSISFVTCPTETICYAIAGGTGARSEDGGKTWQQRGSLPSVDRESPQGMACPDAHICVVSFSYCCIEGTYGDIFLSTDGATSWKRVDHLDRRSPGAVTCPQVTTCYVPVGATVLRTTDAGRTWSSRRLLDPAGGIAGSLACPGPTTCYAIAGFTVLKTGDGFAHTRETLAQSGFHFVLPNAVTCPSATSCYAAEEYGRYEAEESGIAATTDRGRTWRERPKPLGEMTRLSCPTPRVCYAITGYAGALRISRTADGARRWQLLTSPYGDGPQDISCASATTCYVTSAFLDYAHGSTLLALLVTHDGGTTWTLHTEIDGIARAGATSGDTPVTLGRVSCPSVTTCFVMSTTVHLNGPSVGQSLESIVVLSTTDGGATWRRHSPVPPWVVGNHGDPPLLTCPTVRDCYVVQYNVYTTPKNAPAVILATHDGGASWHRSAVAADTVLEDIACSGAGTCRAVGTTGIYASSNGGMTWQQELMKDGEQPPALFGIACPAVDTCYAVGGADIVATSPRK
jgi:photosystem II stability/assembly factor-like uncharacterized protein